jgi:hypothetical protein
MKRILILLSCAAFLFAGCQVDNYDAPDAQVYGSFLDEKTGELVGTDIENGNSIIVVEQGFENPSNQYWNIKNTGEYRNNFVFSAMYDIKFENCNFYPFSQNDVKIKKGENKLDFTVTPYIRVVNPSIVKENGKIVAKFRLEAGKSEVRLNSVQLFAFSDMWVGNSVKYSLSGGTDKQSFENIAINSSTEYTLTIDLAENKNSFKYTGKNYYFRIGALASVSGVGTVRHNYSPLVAIPF